MIRGYVNQGERLQPVENAPERLDSFVWIDLVSPSPEVEADVEARLGVNVPTRDEMSEIEISSRLYRDDGTIFINAHLPAPPAQEPPVVAPLPFPLTARRLTHAT